MATISIDMFMPEKKELAAILQEELRLDFEEVTVEWVDCPDLTQDPFNLAAPGLCGDTALLDIGGISNLFPSPKKEKIFYFKNILQELNRIQSDNFIIGGGLYEEQSNKYLCELTMNTSFLPKADGQIDLKYYNYYVFSSTQINSDQETFKSQWSNYTNPKCNIYGNFFVSKGLRGQVLKIEAKKRTGHDFIDSLQHAIDRYPDKTDTQLIGIGGTFLVKNGATIFHIMRNDWTGPKETKDEIRNCIDYMMEQTPVVGFATFVSADRYVFNMKPEMKEVLLTRSHAHVHSHLYGGHYHGTELDDNTEFLGYFSVATKLHRIDPVPIFPEMADFSCL